MNRVIQLLKSTKEKQEQALTQLPKMVDENVATVAVEGEQFIKEIDQALLVLSSVGKSLRDFTDDDILDELDADMNYWGVPQGGIESMRQDWRNRFLILRRKR